MSLDITNDESTLDYVMAWCRQAQAIAWANVAPDLCRQNGVTMSQWVKNLD